jgi:glycosyltransferase involved in cell wall biosynthesis
MRIALVAPLYEAVPPQAYGGTERVIAGLADELVRRGHDVTLFAAGGSRTSARLVAMAPAPLRLTMSREQLIEVSQHLHLQMLAEVYRRAAEFDIVHAHTDILTLPFVRFTEVPTVITLHGRLDLDVLQQTVPLYLDVPLVSISDSQRAPLDSFATNWVGTCPNGLPLDEYLSMERGKGDYLAFVGRITEDKHVDWAVDVARRAGLPLRVAAKVDPMDEEYWQTTIRPLFERYDVDYLGELDESRKPAFLAGARAMLFPIDWPEPFGLVMIESLAAGTPVIAMRRGSVPEVIEHGVSGFICDSVDEMVAAVHDVGRISPEACRQRARRFTSEQMTEDYLAVYESVIATNRDQRRSMSPSAPITGAL